MTTLQHDQHHDSHADDHGDGHHGPWFLQHHWNNPKQQFEAGKLGMWLFLATEILLFGGLFCGYAIWRANNPELFQFGSKYLDTKMGAINTVVLILSSLTMAWAVTAAQQGKQGVLKVCLLLTLAGAATFMAIKYFEYTHKFHEGWFPGGALYAEPPHHGEHAAAGGTAHAMTTETAAAAPSGAVIDPTLPPAEASTIAKAPQGPQGIFTDRVDAYSAPKPHHDAEHLKHPVDAPDRPKNAHMFFNIYFMMTGLHGIHVIIGGIVIIWLFVKSMKGQFGPDYFTPVDLGGLYWHVVDLIWIFLFPLFYLIH